MASATEIAAIVIDGMAAVCKPVNEPKTDPEGYRRCQAAFTESMAPFTQAVLQRGMALWLEEWTYPTWPTPAKLRVFMCRAQRDMGKANPAPRLPPPSRFNGPPVNVQGSLAFALESDMTDEQVYDYLYGDTRVPAHKTKTLENIERLKAGEKLYG